MMDIVERIAALAATVPEQQTPTVLTLYRSLLQRYGRDSEAVKAALYRYLKGSVPEILTIEDRDNRSK